jgi:protein-disulfide isomerase
MPPKPRVGKPKDRRPGPQQRQAPGGGGPVTRRNLLLALGGAAVVAVALIVGSLVLAGGDDDESSPGTTTTAPSQLLAGIPQDGTLLGDAAATVTLIEYADIQCPICRQYAEGIFPSLVEEYVRPGRVRMEFRGLAFLGADSEKALRHTLAAGQQNHLWEFLDALFGSQGEENSGWVTDDLLREIGEAIPGLDVDRMLADADSQAVTDEMAESNAQAQDAEVPGTPWFFVQVGDEEPYALEVSSLDQFRAALDDALDG